MNKTAWMLIIAFFLVLIPLDVGAILTILAYPDQVEMNILFGLSMLFASLACITAGIALYFRSIGRVSIKRKP